jgi:hypothetical protein
LFAPQTAKRSLRSSQSSVGSFVVPFNKNKTFADKSFSTVGPRLWNELPIEIRQSETVDSFKKQLKTHFSETIILFSKSSALRGKGL